MDNPKRFFSKMDEDRKGAKNYCNLKIQVQETIFDVHRCVLGCSSEYFDRRLNSQLEQGSASIIDVVGPCGGEICNETMSEVLSFLYTGQASLTCSNVLSILVAADYMDFENLKNVCLRFHSRNLSVKSCLEVLSNPLLLNESSLVKESSAFLWNKLHEFPQTESFHELDFDSLKTIFDLNTRKNASEIDKYEAIKSWINFDNKDRSHHVENLLSYVDFEQMPLQVIKDLFLGKGTIIKKSNNAVIIITEILLERHSIMNELKVRPPHDKTSKIWIIDGRDKGLYRSDQEFDVVNGKLSSINCNYLEDCKCPIDDKFKEIDDGIEKTVSVYIASGKNIVQILICSNKESEDEEEISIHCYSTTKLSSTRDYGAGVYVNDCLYVVAGIGHKSIEVYKPSSDTVEIVGNLNKSRWKHAAVSFGQHIYVLGGKNDNDKVLDCAECFDTQTGTSMEISSMHTCRSELCAVAFNGFVVAIGGQDGTNAVNTVEIYNIKTQEWKFLSPMNHCRAGASACYANGKIYVIGGRGRGGSYDRQNSVESFDIAANKWTMEVESFYFYPDLESCLVVEYRDSSNQSRLEVVSMNT